MTSPAAPLLRFESYPGIPRLFLDFVRGRSPYHPDLPTLEAADARGRQLLGRKALLPATAFRFRGEEARTLAEDLAAGRAVAIVAGHQVGLFTGPLFTLVKALDVIRVARELTSRGVRAAPVFWALTDDHDLEEVARTARPGHEGPEILVLEGADRGNRRPVGPLPLPDKVREIVEAFRPDARDEAGREILETFASRSAPDAAYGEAFLETLLDLVAPDPLLVLDPLREEVRPSAAEFFSRAAAEEARIRETLRGVSERLVRERGEAPVPYRPEVFPFFEIREGERRRVADPRASLPAIASGEALASTDVLTRPVLKSFLLPVAASVLGPSEVAYHAQALALFSILGSPGSPPPVLLPRSHVILRGPAERRAADALGLSDEDLFSSERGKASEEVPGLAEINEIRRTLEEALSGLTPRLAQLDATLAGAVENSRKKIAYQLEQLSERARKAGQRRDDVAFQRRRRLETMLLPLGKPAERLYPPLVFLLAHGREALGAIRKGAQGSLEGAVIVDVGDAKGEEEKKSHVG